MNSVMLVCFIPTVFSPFTLKCYEHIFEYLRYLNVELALFELVSSSNSAALFGLRWRCRS